jgi:hypothetical protein
VPGSARGEDVSPAHFAAFIFGLVALFFVITQLTSYLYGRLGQTRLLKAQRVVKQSRTKDYYKVLGVARAADPKTIKKAL